MNDDHADALRLYVEAFSDADPGDGPVRMTALDATGMTLRLADASTIRIPFEPPLANADEARSRLVEMVQTARGTGNASASGA